MKKFQSLKETKFKQFTKEQMRSVIGGSASLSADITGTDATLTGGKGGCGCTDYGDTDK
jgi:hypothetical protein